MAQDFRPPTLEELVKILRIATNFRIARDEVTDRITITFEVSKKDCEEEQVHVWTVGSLFLKALSENLDRLHFFESLVQRYGPDKKGATAADCIAFINNELKHLPPTGGLDNTMRRRFYNTVNEKLAELQEWRAFVDYERFENLRKAEEERRKQQQARDREARKQQKRAEEEYQKRKSEEEIRRKMYEEEQRQRFREEAQEGFRQENLHANFEDLFREAKAHFSFRDRFEEAFRAPPPPPPPGVKRRWFEVLGVRPNANKAQIRYAARKLRAKYHPDRYKGKDAHERMVEINAAYAEGLGGL